MNDECGAMAYREWPIIIGQVIMPDPSTISLTELRRKMSAIGQVQAWRMGRAELEGRLDLMRQLS